MRTNELLRHYVDDRSEPAFEKLVKQHIALVYSAALRQVNGDVPAAQDVTQAVFTDLARKAPRLIRHISLAGWLYTSTRFLAAKARRAEQCRRSHEQEAYEMNQLFQSANPDSTWQELRPLLDEAMHDLSATDREAVLMRYFERQPLAEIGTRLGLKENAARMRIDRAMDRLRAALAKRGVTSTITALSAVLTGRAVGSVPAGLAAQVSRAAFTCVAATGGLTWGLLKLAGLMKGNALVAAGAAVLVAGMIVVPKLVTTEATPTTTASTALTPEKTTALMPTAVAGAAAAADSAPVAAAAVRTNQITLHIIADDTGKPVAGATIKFFVGGKTHRRIRSIDPLTELTATDQGVCEVPVSRDTAGLLFIESRTDGFADMDHEWTPNRGQKIPEQYTMRLARSVPIGGLVVDEDGEPVAGAEVEVGTTHLSDNPQPPANPIEIEEKTVTDIHGRWRIDRFAMTDMSGLSFRATHPDYAVNSVIVDSQISERLAGTYMYMLDRGVTVSGIVVDPDGQPVFGAKVQAHSGICSRETTNQPDGTFTLTCCKAGTNKITSVAPGFALTTINLQITNNQTPLRLELARGNLLRLRVVDTNGMPVTNATIRQDFNPAEVATLFQKQTDADGRISWDGAPDGELSFGIQAYGYQSVMRVWVAADGAEHQITLDAARTISGGVRDGTTGLPISFFQIVTGVMRLPPLAEGTNVDWVMSRDFRDGKFRLADHHSGTASMYKFEADGYAPFLTRVVEPDENEVSFDIVLFQKSATTISVLLPDGQPATHAVIGLEMPGANLDWLLEGITPTPKRSHGSVISTDGAGQFDLPPDGSVTRVIATCPDGCAEATPSALASNSTMRLQPWGQIEGTFLSGGKPAVGRVLTLGRTSTIHPFDVETDANGHFVFPRVPPGDFRVCERSASSNYGHIHLMMPPVTVRPRQTTDMLLACFTATVRLSLPTGVEMATNWNITAKAFSTEPAGEGPISASLKESGDGTWVAEDLPPGDYTLEASVVESPKAVMQAKMSFTVPGDSPSGTLDLGEIVFQPVQPSAPQEKAEYSYNLQNMVFEQFLDMYENLAGKRVTVRAMPDHRTSLRLQTVRPLTKSEALQRLEDVLKEQAGVVIVHGPDGSLSAVAKPQDSPH